jgi:hypothetical protein
VFWPAAISGKTARILVDPDAVHTYHYIPDVARGLSILGRADADAYGGPWMLPCAPAGTLRELAERFSKHLGGDIRVSAVPRWAVKTLGVFVRILREIDEMAYQWDEPFVIDDRRFRERFEEHPVDVDEAAAATVTWARQHYARK